MLRNKKRAGFVRVTQNEKEKMHDQVEYYQQSQLIKHLLSRSVKRNSDPAIAIVEIESDIKSEFKKIEVGYKLISWSSPDLVVHQVVNLEKERAWLNHSFFYPHRNNPHRRDEINKSLFDWAKGESRMQCYVQRIDELNAERKIQVEALQETLRLAIHRLNFEIKVGAQDSLTKQKMDELINLRDKLLYHLRKTGAGILKGRPIVEENHYSRKFK